MTCGMDRYDRNEIARACATMYTQNLPECNYIDVYVKFLYNLLMIISAKYSLVKKKKF